jgi:MoaA/NifB/PqqE/SkfB family radical SAM enzyme
MTIPAAIGLRLRKMNLELNRLETVFQKPELISSPPVLQLPTGTRCNLRCSFCTERGPGMDERYEDLSLDDFIHMSEGLNWASIVQLWGWGEPFLNPHYPAIFDYVTKNYPGIEINISTNGTLLDEAWQRKLLEFGNISVNVSINAATRNSYRRITGKDLFARLGENLRLFRMMREEYRGRARVLFSVSFVVIDENLQEMADFIDLAGDFGADHVQFMDLMHITSSAPAISAAPHGAAVRERLAEALARAAARGIGVGSFLPYAENDYLALDRYGNGAPVSVDGACLQVKPCYEPWKTMLVCSDGTATLCCRSGVVTGNLLKSGLDAVWNSDVYRYYRESVNSPAPPDVCRSCPVKMGISS